MVGDMLAGRANVLPVPADDERESSLLTTSLHAGAEIDDDVAVVVSTSGMTGTPKGAMLTAAALIASAEATHHRLGGRDVAAGVPGLSRRRAPGAGAQRRGGHHAGGDPAALRRLPIFVSAIDAMGPRTPVRVAGGRPAGQGAAAIRVGQPRWRRWTPC